ncbi:type VII secretion target [Saccharopolyspora spinosa]|uniref:Excreted virulence factor EspC (Type VII ESX diderm) n=1 Tax=Saccharopolyspora spinosa TaxID=60894 RepID=A0A2N3Y594_SACSN|nr:type VII secretion target [Saccharopolyspora spinosa]PKW18106.1 excreted virulence factor EspC (type VII ESX diderm) [Saccharopolyspora spinosa]
MSNVVSVDVEHLRRMSQELRTTADELRARILTFREEAENMRGAYGSTPDAVESEREYQETTAQTVEQLMKMYREVVEVADALQDEARHFSDVDAQAAVTAATPMKDAN